MLINSHSKEVAEYVKKIMTGDYYREDDDYIQKRLYIQILYKT